MFGEVPLVEIGMLELIEQCRLVHWNARLDGSVPLSYIGMLGLSGTVSISQILCLISSV